MWSFSKVILNWSRILLAIELLNCLLVNSNQRKLNLELLDLVIFNGNLELFKNFVTIEVGMCSFSIVFQLGNSLLAPYSLLFIQKVYF